MPNIASILEQGPTLSYEFFPPKNQAQADNLRAVVGELAVTNPDFISVTYGALGNGRQETRDAVIRKNDLWPFPAMAHLTCVGHKYREIEETVDVYAGAGIENILALRGDGDAPGDFQYAIELATLIKDRHPGMSVGVAAHPELHPKSPNRKQDRETLAAKLEIADFAITQFFFDADPYHRLVEELDSLGNTKPVIPGIMLFTAKRGLFRMSEMNNTSIPNDLLAKLEKIDAPAEIRKLAVETSVKLLTDLRKEGIPGTHIYTLNRSEPALELKKQLD